MPKHFATGDIVNYYGRYYHVVGFTADGCAQLIMMGAPPFPQWMGDRFSHEVIPPSAFGSVICWEKLGEWRRAVERVR